MKEPRGRQRPAIGGMFHTLSKHPYPEAARALCPGRGFLYRCPVTGYNVRGFIADDPTRDEDDKTFQPVTCTMCTRVHLVNPKTGQVVGEIEPTFKGGSS